jgi:hypothetical protein
MVIGSNLLIAIFYASFSIYLIQTVIAKDINLQGVEIFIEI